MRDSWPVVTVNCVLTFISSEAKRLPATILLAMHSKYLAVIVKSVTEILNFHHSKGTAK